MRKLLPTLALSLLVVSCSSTSGGFTGNDETDIAGIEAEIASQLEDQAEVAVDVNCPSSIEWRVGDSFNCIVESVEGDRAMAEVHMENEDGEYTWETH